MTGTIEPTTAEKKPKRPPAPKTRPLSFEVDAYLYNELRWIAEREERTLEQQARYVLARFVWTEIDKRDAAMRTPPVSQ